MGELLGRIVLFGLLTAIFTWGSALLLPAGDAVAGAAVLGAAAVMAGWALLRRDGWPIGALGLVPDRRALTEGGLGAVAGIAVAGVAMALMAAAGGLVWRADGTPWSLAGWAGEGLRSLLWLLVPAAAEEVLLRGYVLGATARVIGASPALWITSVVFGLLHVANPGAGPLALAGVTVAGLFLGALVLRTGSLWPAIGAHLGWNWALGFLADVPVSGLEIADAPGFDGAARGAAWLGGGGFGVEASALTVVVLAGAAWVVWRRVPIGVAPDRPVPPWIETDDGLNRTTTCSE